MSCTDRLIVIALLVAAIAVLTMTAALHPWTYPAPAPPFL